MRDVKGKKNPRCRISPTRDDFHIPAARLRPGWKSAKPKTGFSLSHTRLATTVFVSSLKTENAKNEVGRCWASTSSFSGSLCIGKGPDFRIILAFENAPRLRFAAGMLSRARRAECGANPPGGTASG